MASLLGTSATSRYRAPKIEISAGTSVSERNVNMFEDIFKEFLKDEHERLLMPPLFALDISKKPLDTEAWREIKIVPADDISVTLTGHPLVLLSSYSCSIHGLAHMYQLSHLEVMRRYVDAELAIYSLTSVLKASIGRTLDSVLKLGMGQRPEGLSVESTEFKNLIVNMKESIPYLPLKIDRDKLVLLESTSLLEQLLAFERPAVKNLKDSVKEGIRKDVNTRVMRILTENLEKPLYLEALGLASSLSEILPESYLNLMFYASYLTGLGAQGLLSMAQRIAKEENKVKVLAMVEREAEGGGNRLELVFEYNIFDYEELVKHKENLLKTVDDALEICKKGRSYERLRYVRQKIDSAKTPQDLQFLSDDFSQTIFSQRLAPNQPPAHYIHANSFSYNKDAVTLFSSFFSDLTIATNLLKALLDALERGGDLRKAAEGAIVCPFRKAPQMRCVWKPECDHEKPWFDALASY